MALEFMKIPGLQKILTSLDFKSYLIGVDKLPDYRDASYCTYKITSDAEARSGKLYYNKVPQARGGFAYEPCSHFKLEFAKHLAACTPYEFCKITPVAILLKGTNTYKYCTVDTDGTVKEVTLSNININNDQTMYYYRNLNSNKLERLAFHVSGSDVFIRAQGYFYGRETSSSSWMAGMTAVNNTYYTVANGASKFNALNGVTYGSIATYESTHNCAVYVRVRSESSSALTATIVYNCGWYLGAGNSDTIYNVDLSMGALTEYNLSTSTPLAEQSMIITSDAAFIRGKTYYIKTVPTLSSVEVIGTDGSTKTNVNNVTWLFSNFRALAKTEYNSYPTIAAYLEDHPGVDVYEENSNYWLQPSGFVGLLTRDYDWYERVGDRFPYAGFVAIATSKYNGQQIGGFYHAKQRQYQLTEDSVHHFRWADASHTSKNSKTYYEWHQATNEYIARDGSEGNLVYRLPDGTSYFQKPTTSTYVEGESYYEFDNTSKKYIAHTGWVAGQPISSKALVATRKCYFRNNWDIIEMGVMYGVTNDVTPVAGKTYYVYTDNNSFAPVSDDQFMTTTTDERFRNDKEYYYVNPNNTSAVGMNKFVKFDASSYIDVEVNRQPYTIYEKNKSGTIPTEVQFCVPFTASIVDGVVVADGYLIPNGINVVVESLCGEAILPDSYYEACEGMYVWEQYFIERGTSVTKPYNVKAIYVDTGSEARPNVTLNLMWTDPKFMLHKDDPNASPDVWAKTDVDLEYVDPDTLKTETIRLVSEVATNDVYSEDFFTVDASTATTFSGHAIDALTFSRAVKTGVIRITATAATGITSEYALRPSKIVWINSEKTFVNMLGGTAVTGVRYYTINADGKETELADVVPYVTDVSSEKIYIKYQKEIETYVGDGSSRNLIVIGDSAHRDGTIVPTDTALYTRVTADPEITMRELIREGLFEKLFSAASGGFNVTGSLLGGVPLLKVDGSNYGNVSVTVVDVDGANLGYNIGQGFVDVLTGVEDDHIILNDETVYYAKQSVTERACADESNDINNIFYELVPVVDITKYAEDGSGRFSNTEGNKGVLFTRTHPNPHYRHYINSKNVRVTSTTDKFEVGVTYNVRKEGVVEFVVLHPDYRGANTTNPLRATVPYFYYKGEPGDLWEELPLKTTGDPSTSYVYLNKPANGKGYRVSNVTSGSFTSEDRYYKFVDGVGYKLLERDTDYTVGDDITSVGYEVYKEWIEEFDMDESDFWMEWEKNTDAKTTSVGLWRFVTWRFHNNRKYYIHYEDVADGGLAEYHIGDNIANWVDENGRAVYVERPGVSEFLDVTEFGNDALRACTVPLYVKDKGVVDGVKKDIYVPLDRPAHNATFRYQYPLSNTSGFGLIGGSTVNNTYWDNSLARNTLMSFGTPKPGKAGYKDYVEFYENHIIPVISTVFKNWKYHVVEEGRIEFDEFDSVRVFDKFWLPCLGNFSVSSVKDTVNGGVIEGVASEGGGLDLYMKGIGQSAFGDELLMARKVRTAGGTGVNWLIRTCPMTTGGTPVVAMVDVNGNLVTSNKTTARYLVPHFTIA